MDYRAIGIGVGITIAVFTGLAWLVANRSLKYQMLAELMKEYAQPDMNDAVAKIWDFYDAYGEDENKLAEEYKQHMNDKGQNINRARRQVSHFYQRMAVLHKGHVLPDKLLFRMWDTDDLEVIPKIVKPLERVHNKIKVGKKIDENKVFKLVDELYEHSKGPGMAFP